MSSELALPVAGTLKPTQVTTTSGPHSFRLLKDLTVPTCGLGAVHVADHVAIIWKEFQFQTVKTEHYMARSLPRRAENKLKKRDGSFIVLRGLRGLVVALQTEDLVGLDRGKPVILKIEERGDLKKEDLPIYQGTYLFPSEVSTKVTDLSRACFPNSLRA